MTMGVRVTVAALLERLAVSRGTPSWPECGVVGRRLHPGGSESREAVTRRMLERRCSPF